MSFALTPTDLTTAVANSTGTVDWTKIAQTAGFPDPTSQPHLQFYNESPCELQLNFSTGEQVMLPAGGWQTIALNPQCTRLQYKVLAVLNASPIIAQLYGTWYAPGEFVPAAPILGNSPIGAAVAVSPIANELQGTGQTNGLTEKDKTGTNQGPMLIPVNLGDALWLGNGNQTAGIRIDGSGNVQIIGPVEMFLATVLDTTLNVSGAATLSSTVHAVGAVTMDAAATVGTTLGVSGATTLSNTLAVAGAITISSKVSTYNNEATAGAGLPYIVALAENFPVSSTGLVSILTYTTPNDGNNHSMRVNAWADVNNGTSGNNLSLQVVYTDPRTGVTSTTPFSTATSTASQSFNGAASIVNGRYAMYPYYIYCKPNTTVTIQYRDPTNTPNDHVSAFIERIS